MSEFTYILMDNICLEIEMSMIVGDACVENVNIEVFGYAYSIKQHLKY